LLSREFSDYSVVRRQCAAEQQLNKGIALPLAGPRLAERGAMRNMTMTSAVSPYRLPAALCATALAAAAFAAPAEAQYQQHIGNDMSKCAGEGPAVRIAVSGIKSSSGKLRVQLYRGTKADWLEKGRWIYRIELPARAGAMSVCMPVPSAGTYGIAVRHDVNGNGKTDISQDGGGMSNNPSINILNLGRPSYTKTAFAVGSEVKAISIRMRYM
jgi:uncharacterized protein (DUF2141 family)